MPRGIRPPLARRVLVAALPPGPGAVRHDSRTPQQKRAPMKLKAQTHITLKSAERAALIAMLRPQSGAGQWISSETYEVTPLVSPMEYVDAFGNLCQRFVM